MREAAVKAISITWKWAVELCALPALLVLMAFHRWLMAERGRGRERPIALRLWIPILMLCAAWVYPFEQLERLRVSTIAKAL